MQQAVSTPTLFDTLRAELRRRGHGPGARRRIQHWVREYVLHHGRRHPARLGREHVEDYLARLARDPRISFLERDAALCALAFLYRCVLGLDAPWIEALLHQRRPVGLAEPHGREELRRLLVHLDATARLIVLLCYGSALRLGECLRLRLKDVDTRGRQVVLRAADGRPLRRAPLAARVLTPLVRQCRRVADLHAGDLAHGAGWAWLPPGLACRHGSAGRELAWQHLFPAPRLDVPLPATHRGERYPLHPARVASHLLRAGRAAGLRCPVTGLSLRASFVSHALEDGWEQDDLRSLLTGGSSSGRGTGLERKGAAAASSTDWRDGDDLRNPADLL